MLASHTGHVFKHSEVLWPEGALQRVGAGARRHRQPRDLGDLAVGLRWWPLRLVREAWGTVQRRAAPHGEVDVGGVRLKARARARVREALTSVPKT